MYRIIGGENFHAENDAEAIRMMPQFVGAAGEYELMRRGSLVFFRGQVDPEQQSVSGRHLTHGAVINYCAPK